MKFEKMFIWIKFNKMITLIPIQVIIAHVFFCIYFLPNTPKINLILKS